MDYSAKNILAIDCSTSEMKLGFQFGADRLVKSITPAEQSHSALIMKGIAQLLHSADSKVQDLNAIVVATGPGSFTGLRIGIAAAKGMAAALGIPVVGVSLFELAAYKIDKAGNEVKVVVPFKKGAFFVAVLQRGKIDESEIATVTSDELKNYVNGGLIAVLGGADISGLIPDKRQLINSEKTKYDASELIYLGVQKLNRKELADLARLEPLYVQKSQAEIKFEQNRNQKA